MKHRAEVEITTDLNSGSQKASLLRGLGPLLVSAYQNRPSAPKRIQGRNADFAVGNDGSVTRQPRPNSGRHKITRPRPLVPQGGKRSGRGRQFRIPRPRGPRGIIS